MKNNHPLGHKAHLNKFQRTDKEHAMRPQKTAFYLFILKKDE